MVKKYSIYLGLTEQHNNLKIDPEKALKVISDQFKLIGIEGFNAQLIKGFWNGISEEALKISFINTFNIKEDEFKHKIAYFKGYFNQECILLESQEVDFKFI